MNAPLHLLYPIFCWQVVALLLAVGARAESVRVYEQAVRGTTSLSDGSVTQAKLAAGVLATEYNTYVSSKTFTNSAGVLIKGAITVPASTISSIASVTSTVTALGSVSVYSGVMSNVLLDDVTNHSADTSHIIGVIGVATTNVNSNAYTFGLEGRVNAQDRSANSSNAVYHTGVLGYVNGYDGASRSDNNVLVGVEARARKTTLSDGAGAVLSTGTVIGLGVFNVVGGASNYGVYVASGTLNYLAGNTGIGVGNSSPSFPLDVKDFSAANSGTARFLSGAGATPLAMYYGRSASDLVAGVAAGAGQFVNSSVAGDAFWRSGGGKMIWSGDSNGVRTDMSLLASGYVGIGLSAPVAQLNVSASNSTPTVINGYAPHGGNTALGGSLALGNGTANQGLFEYDGTTGLMYMSNTYDNAGGDIRFRTKTTGTGVDALTIKGDGLVGIGTVSPCSTCTLHVSGAGNFTGALRQGSLRSCTTGTQTNADGLFSACVASDRTLKNAIKPLGALPSIDLLRPVTYRWKDTSARDAKNHIGFIAQEVEAVYPDAVVSAGLGLKGLDSNALIAVLVQEVQSLRKRVQALEKK